LYIKLILLKINKSFLQGFGTLTKVIAFEYKWPLFLNKLTEMTKLKSKINVRD
jgi:hypothetical protein